MDLQQTEMALTALLDWMSEQDNDAISSHTGEIREAQRLIQSMLAGSNKQGDDIVLQRVRAALVEAEVSARGEGLDDFAGRIRAILAAKQPFG